MNYYEKKLKRGNWTAMFTVYLGIAIVLGMLLTFLTQ